MQTIHIEVEDSKVDILLTIIDNLKDGVIRSYTVSSEDDPYFLQRQTRLHTLKAAIDRGDEPLYDFDQTARSLIEELKA